MKLDIRTTTTALAAVAAAGVSSLVVGVAPASAADAEVCDDGTLIAPGVCEQTFTSGTATFTPSATATALEILLVGAGGTGADQSLPNTNGYAAGGGGGEVRIVDFAGVTDPITITVPTVGAAGGASSGSTVAAVANGVAATDFGTSGGASGSGYAGASGGGHNYGAGAGAAGSPANSADGGAGVVVGDIAPSGSLFTGDTRCFGGGGAVGGVDFAPGTFDLIGFAGVPGCGGGGPADTTGTTLVAPVANSGGGGGGVVTPQSFASRAGAAGIVVVRWTATNVALRFDVGGHGTAPATQSVVPGTAGSAPADPVADGYRFDGWFSDSALTVPADFAATLTASTTVYAKWSVVLPATGAAVDATAAPIALTALFAGAGILTVAAVRRRRAHPSR